MATVPMGPRKRKAAERRLREVEKELRSLHRQVLPREERAERWRKLLDEMSDLHDELGIEPHPREPASGTQDETEIGPSAIECKKCRVPIQFAVAAETLGQIKATCKAAGMSDDAACDTANQQGPLCRKCMPRWGEGEADLSPREQAKVRVDSHKVESPNPAMG